MPRRPFTRSNPPKPFPFLKLPGELRNRIYDLVIEQRRVGVWRTRPRLELAQHKQARHAPKDVWSDEESQKIPRPRLNHLDLPLAVSPFDAGQHLSRPSPISLKFLLTCRQIYDEAITYLYAKTRFVFRSPRSISHFLRGVPSVGLEAIRCVEIEYYTYGEPRLTEFREYKERHDEKWLFTCISIAEKMTGLQELTLEMGICDWPTKMDLTADWALPLLLLAERKLDRADVTLKHKAFDEQQLQLTSDALEDALMTAEGREKRNAERVVLEAIRRQKEAARQKKLNPPKAKQTLVIRPMSLDEIAKINKYVHLG